MIRMKLGFALVGALIAAPALAQTQPAANRPVEFTVSGIPVIFKQITANDVVAVRLYIRGGSAAQSAETSGIERLMGLMMTNGTQKYTKDAFISLATSTGTRINAEATLDYTVLAGQAVKQNWDQAWDLFTEAALRPTFPETELTQLKGQVVSALRQRRDNPDLLLNIMTDSVAYAGTPFAVDPAGTPTSVAAFTREQLAQWHRQRMTKENLLIVVVGNVTRADLEQKIAAAFGSLPATGGAIRPVPVAPLTRSDVVIVPQPSPTNYIAGVFRLPDLGHADYPAARMLMNILNNRFFEEVRTKRNLSYAPAAQSYARSSNLGRFYVTAALPDTTLKVMLFEARRMQAEPVTAKQLQESRNTFTTNYWAGQQTNMGQATQLGMFEMIGGGWENEGAFIERLGRIAPADIQRVAERYLQNGRFVVVGDPAKVDKALFSSF